MTRAALLHLLSTANLDCAVRFERATRRFILKFHGNVSAEERAAAVAQTGVRVVGQAETRAEWRVGQPVLSVLVFVAAERAA